MGKTLSIAAICVGLLCLGMCVWVYSRGGHIGHAPSASTLKMAGLGGMLILFGTGGLISNVIR